MQQMFNTANLLIPKFFTEQTDRQTYYMYGVTTWLLSSSDTC